MLGFSEWRIRWKLALVLGVFTVSFVLFNYRAKLTMERLKVLGPIYQRIALADELKADVLPPPEYIIESYLTVLEMTHERDPAAMATLVSRFRRLKEEYGTRHAYWDRTLESGPTREAMLTHSYPPARDFFQFAESRVIPALRGGGRDEGVRLVEQRLGPLYRAHRLAIDDVTRLSTQARTNEEQRARDELLRDRAEMALWAVGAVGAVLLLSWLVFRAIALKLTELVNVIMTISAEFAATVEEQERVASQQAAAVNQTTTTMEELGASSSLSAEQAEAAASGARQALSLADDGMRTVQQTLQGMGALKETSGTIADHILRLSEQTSQIGGITNLVSDLAVQTNLLALNAAVEAARAGEQGRGFAVVAAEIRKLADQSKKSAERISLLVAEIQRATSAAVMVTDQGTRTAEQGTLQTQRTGEAFTGLAGSIGTSFESIQQIALNVKQQAEAVHQVVEAMTSLNAGARETVSGVTQTRAGLDHLNGASRALKAIL